jgi:putative membrane protein
VGHRLVLQVHARSPNVSIGGRSADGHPGTALALPSGVSTAPDSLPNGKPDPDVFFSAERTYLAWIRTGVALMGFGFVLARFALVVHELRSMGRDPLPEDAPDVSRYFGMGLVMVGVLLTGAATISHVKTIRRLNSGQPFVGRPTWVGITVALVLAAVGTLMSIYLVRES